MSARIEWLVSATRKPEGLTLSLQGAPETTPGPRVMFPKSAPQFQRLRMHMEAEWIPQMMEVLDMAASDLPLIWDADFLLGPKARHGEDTYVLCEINVSSVLPVPEEAFEEIAHLIEQKLSVSGS
jgi:hypothetical protein